MVESMTLFLRSIHLTGSEKVRKSVVVAPSCGPRVLLEQDPAHKLYATGHHNIVNVPGTDEWVIAYRRFTYNPPISRVAGDADSVAQYVKRE
ncbi:glycoside hydrolase family protein [Bifidobacterium longum]|uniref:hypothetical protein n=1 Tax=Bifidobacterium longum TaxID=216816 RepID=UPI0029904BC4|nr:hypothetical protein [Bifidobacterium longum]